MKEEIMGKRYIDADALIQRLEELAEDEWNKEVGASMHFCDCADLVDDFPTTDVRENVKGKWVYQSFGGYHCNQCGNQAPFWCMASTQNLTDFCPNCGAEMERSDNG